MLPPESTHQAPRMEQVLLWSLSTTHSLSLCPVTLDWDSEKESWRVTVTAWVIFLNLDSELGAYPLSSFTTARRESDSIFEVCPLLAFRLYSSPFPLAPYLDKLVRKPNKPCTTRGRFKPCAP